jgi:2-polyprenyl-3-methyl-5-hydroxy-6-metoxy-1,4-benzoquinol methylase
MNSRAVAEIQLAHMHWARGRFEPALNAAWMAYDIEPHNRAAKVLLARLLRVCPGNIRPERKSALLDLLRDQQIDPDYVSPAGWYLVFGDGSSEIARSDAEFEVLAAELDSDNLALTLLRESPVFFHFAERTLSRVRRWLLLSKQWPHYPRLIDALVMQAVLNGGAWPFDATEHSLFEAKQRIVAAYLPRQEGASQSHYTEAPDPVTRAVTAAYERWPWPIWKRIMVGEDSRMSDTVPAPDPKGPNNLPNAAKILIAGCGTGREAAIIALKYPDADITAIDLSEASLNYARARCSALGIRQIQFLKLDLHNVAELNQKFDAVFCAGVLHHLPTPERGLAVLTAVVRPGGVMKIMVYSRIARLWLAAVRPLINDLTAEPLSDDLLRRVRQRIMQQSHCWPAKLVMQTENFGTLAGTYDLLLHCHEDPFDISRIAAAFDRCGLRLLSFLLPTPDAAARYHARFPHDPMHRDLRSLQLFEKSEPTIFGDMYEFWCRRELIANGPS